MIAQSDTQWPEAAIAIAGVLLVLAVTVALIWSVATTVRARVIVQREEAYRKLAADSVDAQRQTADQLERAVAELSSLGSRTSELERLIRTVE